MPKESIIDIEFQEGHWFQGICLKCEYLLTHDPSDLFYERRLIWKMMKYQAAEGIIEDRIFKRQVLYVSLNE